MKAPRIVIAAERSDAGKSTIVVGILLALRKRGIDAQPFKAGPDFLDPMHHSIIMKRKSRNLDTWMFPEMVRPLFTKNSEGADISIVEGVMGFYDGVDGISEEGSTAHLAKMIDAPVILILDAKGSARSMGAVALGFKAYDKDADIQGIIFNKVGSEKHLSMLETSLRGVRSLGGMPRAPDISLESRHLGLVPAEETYDMEKYEKIASLVEEHIDLDAIIDIANSASEIDPYPPPDDCGCCDVTLAVAKDMAFNFYYQDNLDMIEACGASIAYFSPLKDDLPDADGVYLGGGYPELFSDTLFANTKLRKQIKQKSDDGMPIYAECGGMMYLCDNVVGLDGTSRKMTGVFDASIEMSGRLKALSYVQAKTTCNTPLLGKGTEFRGHEFHYSHVKECSEDVFAYDMKYGKGICDGKDGFIRNNTLASYTHLHFGNNMEMPQRFVDSLKSYSRT